MKPGQTSCYHCPRGTFTKDPNGGAKSIRQCKGKEYSLKWQVQLGDGQVAMA